MSNFSATSGDSDPQTIYLQNYCHLFPVCFLVYDQIITLAKEIDLVWRRPRAPSAYWFLALRYGALMINLPIGVFSFVSLPSPKVWMLQLRRRASSFHASHRACSLSGHDYSSLRSLWAQCARFVVADWNRGMSNGSYCVGRRGRPAWTSPNRTFGMPFLHRSIRLISSSHCVGVFVRIRLYYFGLTVYNAYLTRRAVGPDQAMPIHRLMVRDGAIYFAAMAFANLTNITTFFINGRLLPGSLATFATCTSVAMVTHLLLDLYECKYGAMVPNLSEVEGELELPVDPV
ncbi:hypothetical protein B0H14DRAFT_1161370 [Mycena olivaceomarginata]|nr:hypothetical protein B0H14DRAFT_1161370 [Mycena olivaceomarginata]